VLLSQALFLWRKGLVTIAMALLSVDPGLYEPKVCQSGLDEVFVVIKEGFSS